jgi:hypothetical protein
MRATPLHKKGKRLSGSRPLSTILDYGIRAEAIGAAQLERRNKVKRGVKRHRCIHLFIDTEVIQI